jgi:hypothetical protein
MNWKYKLIILKIIKRKIMIIIIKIFLKEIKEY